MENLRLAPTRRSARPRSGRCMAGCLLTKFLSVNRLPIAVLILFAAASVMRLNAQTAPAGPLVVFNAGSLGKPFNELLRAFKTKYPEVVPAQENSGSLE